MFIEVLFTIVRTWKQPKCPLTNERIKEQWYIYAVEYSSAIKSNAFESVLMRWVNLESIRQSEVNQKEKNNYHILTHIYGILKDGTDETIFRAAVETQALKKKTYGLREVGKEGDGGRYFTICKIDSQWEFALLLR